MPFHQLLEGPQIAFSRFPDTAQKRGVLIQSFLGRIILHSSEHLTPMGQLAGAESHRSLGLVTRIINNKCDFTLGCSVSRCAKLRQSVSYGWLMVGING